MIVYIYICNSCCTKLICWNVYDHIRFSCMGSLDGNLEMNVNLGLFGLIKM